MKDREFEMEDAYQIFVLFMQCFWWDFLRHIMIKKELVKEGLTPEKFEAASPEERAKSELFKANDLVFNTIPGDPYGCRYDLEGLIEKRLNVPIGKQQEEIKIKEEDLFQLIIDFCNHFNNKFEGPPNDYPLDAMCFAIDFLEDMRKHPENHQQEWDIWNEIIDDILIRGYKTSALFRGSM